LASSFFPLKFLFKIQPVGFAIDNWLGYYSDIIQIMIRGIITDVDGVIVGEKIGFNSPNPHPDVLSKLKEIKAKDISITLCIAKPHYSITEIIEGANLSNPHITDGGGVIINPVTNEIVKKHCIESDSAADVLKTYLDNNVYVEFYTPEFYCIQKDQVSKITKQHTHILQKDPKIAGSIVEKARKSEITKIMPIAKDEEDKKRLADIFEPFKDKLTLSWGVHPVALPLQFGIITAPNISKKQGAVDVVNSLSLSFDEMLGVGDSTSDWQFIEMCKYSGAMGNASDELKDLVKSKGEGNYFIGPTVDENGILPILNHFLL